MQRFFLLALSLLVIRGNMFGQVVGDFRSLQTGNWSDPATWEVYNGSSWDPATTYPTSSSHVTIRDGHTVTIDSVAASYTIAGLTVGEGTSGVLQFANNDIINLVVTGDILVQPNGSFKVLIRTSGNHEVIHTVTVYGNLTNQGSTFDMRAGTAGTTLSVCNFKFVGTGNSVITMGTFSNTNNEFNGIEIDKSEEGKIILGSDVVIQSGSTTQPNASTYLRLTRGKIVTGQYKLIHLWANSAGVVGGSDSSYVQGALGRGMSNSGGATRKFEIGDENGYRPITIRSTTSGTATGHYAWAKVSSGNANTGSSTLVGGIDKVSVVRFYEVGYGITIGGAASMSFDLSSPSYGFDDGVVPGNTDLRVAYSTDNRATWIGLGQTTPHTTDLSNPPTTITPDPFSTAVTINAGNGGLFITLASVASDNPLPVELTLFTASQDGAGVLLKWQTATESNSARFEIYRCAVGSALFSMIGRVQAAGTSNSPKEYVYRDNTVTSGRYFYELKQIDVDGTSKGVGRTEIEILAPKVLTLINYPNPFNPQTVIEFTVPTDTYAVLKVYNVLGQEVARLFEGVAKAGEYYRVNFGNSAMSSGVYYYTLETMGTCVVKKMVLVK